MLHYDDTVVFCPRYNVTFPLSFPRPFIPFAMSATPSYRVVQNHLNWGIKIDNLWQNYSVSTGPAHIWATPFLAYMMVNQKILFCHLKYKVVGLLWHITLFDLTSMMWQNDSYNQTSIFKHFCDPQNFNIVPGFSHQLWWHQLHSQSVIEMLS